MRMPDATLNPQPSTLNQQDALITRRELAKALKIGLRTVDQMLADQELTPIRMGKLVRFHLPDVLTELRSRAQTSKHSVTRNI